MTGERSGDPHDVQREGLMERVERALVELGLSGSRVTVAGGGSDAPVYRVEAPDGTTYALRARGAGEEALVAREARNLEAARAAGVPCPALVRRVLRSSSPSLLTTWDAGTLMLDAIQKDPSAVRTLGRDAGRLQARLHRARLSDSRAALLDAGWARPASREEETLLRTLPRGGRLALLHLDLHPLNILVADGAVSSLIDWVNAGVGDARCDVARTAAILSLDGPPPGSEARRTADVLLSAWMSAYQAETGPLSDMGPFLVWAGAATLRDLRQKRPPGQMAAMRRTVDAWANGRSWPEPWPAG